MTTGVRLTSHRDLVDLMGIPFSDQQLAAIAAPLEPGVIVAGAGSGKTTVMAARVVWLVGTGAVQPDEVLGLTFTNKAASELSSRVRDYLARAGLIRRPGAAATDDGSDVAEPTVLTYHAYAARLLAEHGLRIGHEPDTRLIADASRFQLAARAVRHHRDPVDHLTTWLATNVSGLLALDAQLSEHLVPIEALLDFQRREAPQWLDTRQTIEVARTVTTFHKRRELLGFVESYRRLKRDLGVMDFSDQMSKAAVLARDCPEVGGVERDRFKVVLLDEYQDTSFAQAKLLTSLFSGPSSESGRGHAVTAVGDPCQAIYGWRGASVTNIDRFPDDFPGADRSASARAVRQPLSVSRRSDARILETANQLAGVLYRAHAGTEPLEPRPDARPGVVRAAIVSTYQDELDFLAAEVPRAYAEMPVPTWSGIGVLVRDNKTAADVHDALTAAGVPVEVVGLSGLLQMPEVAEVVATLQVLHDVTANSSVLALLSGPRWAIGVRDLALLGRRARRLAEPPSVDTTDIAAELEEAVAGVDPADIVSLVEALEDPGAYDYSDEARERFAMVVKELRLLRRYVGEPLLDLVRRVIDVTGIDVELASSTSAVASARRDNLSAFLDAVSSFAGIDGDASLPGLLAYFAAEEEYGQGLSLALPTEANSVKLLTVHRAKGLEWDVVFVPGLCKRVFPSAQGRSRWPTAMAELPWPLRGDAADLPAVADRSNKGLTAFKEACRDYDLLEERRLAYVAVTRPRHQLVVSCHWWGPQQKQPRGPSEFMLEIIDAMQAWGEPPELEVPAPDAEVQNPANRALERYGWPIEAAPDEVFRRRAAATLVNDTRSRGWRQVAQRADDELMLDERARVDQWDLEIDRLLEEATMSGRDDVVVPLPAALSATTMLRIKDNPAAVARDLARPMPRKPSPAARFGTRFHAWVEAHVGQQPLLDPDDLPGRADQEIGGEGELQELIDAFVAGPFSDRRPHQVEAPFALVLGGQVVRGRIDAIYATTAGFLVVDWKTNRDQTADPLQLAIYRLAWAELTGTPLADVEAAFYYVRSGDVVSYDDLPGRSELELLLHDQPSTDPPQTTPA
jgi:DNA helicase-2/ATP-dependent DNA helicase PcrA